MKNELLTQYKKATLFYKNKLSCIISFDNAPFTTKAELLNSQLQFPPYGDFTDNKKKIAQVYRTSGTSESPLLLTFTNQDIQTITEIGKDCFSHCRMGKNGNKEIVINCMNLSMWAGGFLDSQSMLKTGVQVINFGTGNTTGLVKLINNLNNRDFKVSIHCTPSYLPKIESRLQEAFKIAPRELKLNAFYLGGEAGVQNNEFRNKLQETWKCKVFNANYGMSEICSIMASATDDNTLKFSELYLKYYFNELLVNNSTKSFADISEGDEGDLIVTSLIKQSQPLLRYQTKEKIRILRVDKTEIYFEVIGRSDDMLVYKGINIFPEQFRTIISRFSELSGIYKILIKTENNMITDMNLVCELSNNIAIPENILRTRLLSKIRENLSIKPGICFTNKIDFNGNKHKIIEYV